MFSQDRQQTRSIFFRAWHNYRNGLPLEGIEKIIIDVALRHPEYRIHLENPKRYEDSDYSPEMGATNPFLHMGMHIAVEEQLSIDQPAGIRSHYQKILTYADDAHAAAFRPRPVTPAHRTKASRPVGRAVEARGPGLTRRRARGGRPGPYTKARRAAPLELRPLLEANRK